MACVLEKSFARSRTVESVVEGASVGEKRGVYVSWEFFLWAAEKVSVGGAECFGQCSRQPQSVLENGGLRAWERSIPPQQVREKASVCEEFRIKVALFGKDSFLVEDTSTDA